MAKDSVRIKVDTGELQRALRDYMAHTSKTLPEAVNKIAIDVAFQANRAAKRATPNNIKRADANGKLFHSLAATGATKFGKAVRGQGNAEIAQKIFDARVRAINYSKAIFLKLAKDLGGNMRSAIGRSLPSGPTATRARNSIRPQAVLDIVGIQDKHAANIIQPAMQGGINAVAKDKREYINRKIAEGARRHSGRGR
jgi:hypothetical protein